jgi:hypothetical protein
MRDDLLRTRLEDSARALADVSVPGMAVLRRRVRRRRARIGAATLAASMVIGATVAALVPGRLDSATRHPADGGSVATPGWRPAGRPLAADASVTAAPYYITLDDAFTPATMNSPVAEALVVDAFTGKVLALVRPPAGAGYFTSAAAAGDDRTFFLAASSSAVYELRLGADGEPLSLAKVYTVPVTGGLISFAVSPDASTLAYVTAHGIEVVSLPSGASHLVPGPGTEIGGLTWIGDRMVAFVMESSSGKPVRFRVVDVEPGPAPPPSVLLDVGGSFGSSLSAPDASVLFATVITGAGENPQAAVEEFSGRTGRLTARLTPWTGESGMGTSCLPLWTDSSGTRGVVECGGVFTFTDGRAVRADLHVPGANFSVPTGSLIAW